MKMISMIPSIGKNYLAIVRKQYQIVFNQLDNKYKSHIETMTKFIDKNKNGVNELVVNKQISKHTKALKLAIDICKTQFRSQIPIIGKTHIEAIRLAEYSFSNTMNIPSDIIL